MQFILHEPAMTTGDGAMDSTEANMKKVATNVKMVPLNGRIAGRSCTAHKVRLKRMKIYTRPVQPSSRGLGTQPHDARGQNPI